jgi:Protein of unknown function (DUF3108)
MKAVSNPQVMRAAAFVFAVFCAALAPSRAALADQLKPFEVSYAWMWHGMTVAVSTVKLEHQGDTWVYSSRSSPRGIGKVFSQRPTQKSVVRVTDKGVQPLSYDADDGTSSTNRDAHVKFDWDTGRVTGVYEDAKVDMPLHPDIQDDSSVQIALMVELLAGREPQKFQLLDKNSVREYSYHREREESIDTAVGKVDTIEYGAQKVGSPRITRFWCAPSRGYIPMRVEQKKDDDVQWTMQLQSIKRE